jgi:hypothetical protein
MQRPKQVSEHDDPGSGVPLGRRDGLSTHRVHSGSDGSQVAQQSAVRTQTICLQDADGVLSLSVRS